MNSKHFLSPGASDEDVDAFVAAVRGDDEEKASPDDSDEADDED